MQEIDTIPLDQTTTLATVFRDRVRRSPDAVAHIQYDNTTRQWREYSWSEIAQEVYRWQQALAGEDLKPGDRVAIMLRNCSEWIIYDLAAQGLGLVTVPIFTNDRPENVGYILQHAGVRVFLIEGSEQWETLKEIRDQLTGLTRIISLEPVESTSSMDPRVTHAKEWLPAEASEQDLQHVDPDTLATIVYTSGTTGRSKGVMLSHRNILYNAEASTRMIDIYTDDLMLSFLPLSHMLERTLGCYLPILAGSRVAFARSVLLLAEDLVSVRPTILISVPRIFERVYAKIQDKLNHDPAIARKLFNKTVEIGWKRFERCQGRAGWTPGLLLWPLLNKLVASKVQAKLGGRLRFAVSGGAALSPAIAKLFIGLGVNIQQGYGLTETSPVITANPLDNNQPASIGMALEGVETKIGKQDELLTRSPCVMLGYWDNPQATRETIDEDGWLYTGDQARQEGKHFYLTGRLKEIIVLANGEKIPPADMEMAIALDSLFEQILVIGEGRPYLTTLIVPNPDEFAKLVRQLGMDQDDQAVFSNEQVKKILLQRIQDRLHAFPGYAKIRNIGVTPEPWDIDNGLMTPTMKLRRGRIIEQYQQLLESLYEGH